MVGSLIKVPEDNKKAAVIILRTNVVLLKFHCFHCFLVNKKIVLGDEAPSGEELKFNEARLGGQYKKSFGNLVYSFCSCAVPKKSKGIYFSWILQRQQNKATRHFLQNQTGKMYFYIFPVLHASLAVIKFNSPATPGFGALFSFALPSLSSNARSSR